MRLTQIYNSESFNLEAFGSDPLCLQKCCFLFAFKNQSNTFDRIRLEKLKKN